MNEQQSLSDKGDSTNIVCRRIHLTKSFWFFIFIFIIVIAIGFSVFWMSFVQVYHGVMVQMKGLHEQNQQLQLQGQKAEADLQKQVLQLQTLTQQVNQHDAVLAQLTQKIGSLPSRWVVPEVRYLIQLANFTLIYEKNVPVVISLLKMADGYLSKVSDQDALKWRERINQHIVELQALPSVDIAGIYFQLTALDGLVDQLEFIQDRFQYQPAASSQDALSWWGKVGNNLLDTLRALVIVRHHDQPVAPFLSDQFRQALIMNFHVLLAQAEWTVLQQQNTVYQGCLSQMQGLLKQYFSQTDPHTQALQIALDNLSKISLVQQLPNLDDIMKDQDQAKTTAPTANLPSKEGKKP